MPSPNIQYAYDYLTGDQIVEATDGRVQPMTPEGASGLIGGWIVETGSEDLSDLDVIEKKARKGRGMSQYTDTRRIPYDAARLKAIDQGIDPNSIEWQMDYAIDEYMGKHDGPSGNSLSGWTRAMENFGQYDDVTKAATGFTVGIDGKEGYFRPSKPHVDRRIEAAQRVYSYMTRPQALQTLNEIRSRFDAAIPPQ